MSLFHQIVKLKNGDLMKKLQIQTRHNCCEERALTKSEDKGASAGAPPGVWEPHSGNQTRADLCVNCEQSKVTCFHVGLNVSSCELLVGTTTTTAASNHV